METKTEIDFPDPDLGAFSTESALLNDKKSHEHQQLKESSVGDALHTVNSALSSVKKGVMVFGGTIPGPLSTITKGLEVSDMIMSNHSGDPVQDAVVGGCGAAAKIQTGAAGINLSAQAVRAVVRLGGHPCIALAVGAAGVVSSTLGAKEIGTVVTSAVNAGFDAMKTDPDLMTDLINQRDGLPIMPSSLRQSALSVSGRGSVVNEHDEHCNDNQAIRHAEQLIDELTVAIQTLPYDIQKESGLFSARKERSNGLQPSNPFVKKLFGSLSKDAIVSSDTKQLIDLLNQMPEHHPNSYPARLAAPKRKRAEPSQIDFNDEKKAKLCDIEAETIAKTFEQHGDVQVLYRTYLESTQKQCGQSQAHEQFLADYKRAVKTYADDKKCQQVWQRAVDNGTTVFYQIAELSHSEKVRDLAVTGAAMNTLWKAKDECSNAFALWQSAKSVGDFGEAVGSSLGTVGLVLSAVSFVVSLFGKKKAKGQVDYSAKTYFAVMELWKDMREQFQIMQKNFEETWRQLGRMDAANQTRFRMLSEAIEKNQIAIERQITQLSHSMHERFNALDWKLDQIERRNRHSAVLSELTEVVKLSNSTLTPSDSARDCHEKAHLLLSQLGDAGSLQEKFSGCRIGLQTEESEQQRVVESLHHPAFSLTVLGSYLNAVVSPDESLYSYSQMTTALFQIAVNKTRYMCLAPKGIADCVKRADWLNTLSQLQPEQKIFVPFDFFGSWLLLVAHRSPSLHLDLFGLQGAVEESAQWLQPYFQAFGIRFKAYPDEVLSNQSSLYTLWLIEQITQDKIQLESAEPLPFAKEAVAKRVVQNPRLEEQQWGNPYVDTWMALHLQRTLALYHDNRKNALTAVPNHLTQEIDTALRRLAIQSQLLTRMQHPNLYRTLFQLYRDACSEFDSVFEQWSLQAARQIETDENINIRQKMLAMEGVVSPTSAYLFGESIQPKTDYNGFSWWTVRYVWQNVCSRYGHGDGFKEKFIHDEGKVNTEKVQFSQKIKNMYLKEIQAQLSQLEGLRQGLRVNHLLTSAILYNDETIAVDAQSVGPYCLIPSESWQPYLKVPEYIHDLIPSVIYDGYRCGLIELRFRYAITSSFEVIGEWREYQLSSNEAWSIFSKKSYEWEPLFYETIEAILGFWYGGKMPLNSNTTRITYGNGWYGKAPTVGCTQYYYQIDLPTEGYRIGAIQTDIRSLQESIPNSERDHQTQMMNKLRQAWVNQLSVRFNEAVTHEMSNQTTQVAKAAAKMDKAIHLLYAYLNTLAFAHQDEALQLDMQTQFNKALFDSQAINACFDDRTQGLQAFKHMRVTPETIDALEDWVMETIHHLPASHQQTPFAIASSLLHQVLRERTELKRQPNLNLRIQMLDQYIMGMRNQVENVFRNLGDGVYNNALRASLRESAEHCARLSGQIEAIQTSDHQELHLLMMNQHKLKKALHELDRLIQRVQALVDQHVLSESTLSYLLTQQSIVRDYYNRIEYQLAGAAEEFDEQYYAHDYVSQLERVAHDEPTDFIEDLDALRDAFLTEVQEKTHALSASMGISLSKTLALIKTLDRLIASSLEVEEGVVFIGPSKNGKSTTINFSHGCLYTAKKDKRGVHFREHIQGDEIAVVGHGNGSQTTIPLITSVIHNKRYALVDMPGVEDNRSLSNEAGISPYEISTAVSLHLIAKKIQKIRCLNVCIAKPLLNNAGFPRALQQIFQQVGRIILGQPRLRKNIKLLITKYSEHDLKEEIMNQVIARIQDFAADPLFQNDQGMLEFFQLFQDENSAKQHIVLVDVIDDTFREQLYAHWDTLEPEPTQQFNFSHCSKHLEQFETLLGQFTGACTIHSAEISSLRKELNTFNSAVARNLRDEEIIRTLNTITLTLLAESLSMSDLLNAQRNLIELLDQMRCLDGLCPVTERMEEQLKTHRIQQKELAQQQLRAEIEERYYQSLGVLPEEEWTESLHQESSATGEGARKVAFSPHIQGSMFTQSSHDRLERGEYYSIRSTGLAARNI
jgi:hypothetical protein